ncbi:ArsR/SmtB family transcription factor [Pseudonocardia pini]|uniref:ArsR/SmtB family transcription factor n=1 Tax=Pseudonocardia pini TaxID=2758030 RepID=UPI001C68AFF5|nr:metalloregulator ArsR/SmtB family transcription factor [Pseudonocardia pini]
MISQTGSTSSDTGPSGAGPEHAGRSRQVLADVAKALAHPDRIWILQLLGDGERSVAELRACTGQVASTLSSHLAVLRHADLVSVRREGPVVCYALVDSSALGVLASLREVVVGAMDRRDVAFGALPEERRRTE